MIGFIPEPMTTTWINDRLAEDEQAEVHSENCALHNWLKFDVPSACDCGWPDRMRREIAAMRRILDEHRHYQNAYNPAKIACGICHSDRHETDWGVGNWCTTVRLVASVWADRDDMPKELRLP